MKFLIGHLGRLLSTYVPETVPHNLTQCIILPIAAWEVLSAARRVMAGDSVRLILGHTASHLELGL